MESTATVYLASSGEPARRADAVRAAEAAGLEVVAVVCDEPLAVPLGASGFVERVPGAPRVLARGEAVFAGSAWLALLRPKPPSRHVAR